MKLNLKKRAEGFTIIEVLIVLAIAGLILLIVFLAVPALQRNSRNTQRKNDVSSALGAVNEWTNNNQGVLPTTAAQQTAALANAKLSSLSGNVTWAAGSSGAVADADHAVIVTAAKCKTPIDGTAVAGSSRQVAIVYGVETGGAFQPTCIDS